MFHGSCHVPDSFCAGIELCLIVCKKLVPEKTCTTLTDERATLWYKFLERMSPTKRTLLWCSEYSAKVTPMHEITPQSDYVNIRSSGDCTWDPRYELAATQCDVDVKWFPFDEQKCNVTFASWLLDKDNIKLSAEVNTDHYLKSDDWNLISEYTINEN